MMVSEVLPGCVRNSRTGEAWFCTVARTGADYQAVMSDAETARGAFREATALSARQRSDMAMPALAANPLLGPGMLQACWQTNFGAADLDQVYFVLATFAKFIQASCPACERCGDLAGPELFQFFAWLEFCGVPEHEIEFAIEVLYEVWSILAAQCAIQGGPLRILEWLRLGFDD